MEKAHWPKTKPIQKGPPTTMASSQGDDEEEVFDDEVLETLKLIKERAANSNDIIDYCLVKVGEPGLLETH